MISIYAAAAISTNHNHVDAIDNTTSNMATTESPLAKNRDMATKAELDAITQHDVFRDFLELPQGRKALPSHWVYMINLLGADFVPQYMARLVCGGNHQIKGMEYRSIYVLTARLGHISLGFAIAAQYYQEINQIDICMAFFAVDDQYAPAT